MPNPDQTIILRPSRELLLSRSVGAIIVGAATIYWITRGELILAVLFGFIMIVNLAVVVMINRRQLHTTGSLLVFKSYKKEKTMDMKQLSSIAYVSPQGIFLKDIQGEKLIIPSIFSKKDLEKLLIYLSPYAMGVTVQRDEAIVKLFRKYNIDQPLA